MRPLLERKDKNPAGGARREDYVAWGIIALLIIFHLVNNLIVLGLDTVPFVHDPADIYLNAVRLRVTMETANPMGLLRTFYVDSSKVYPPLFAGVAAVVMALFGTSQDVAMMANTPFLVILLVSTYLLGKRLFGPRTGLIAATLVSFFPGIFSPMRTTMVDFALTAMVPLSLYLLLQTEYLSSIRWSILFGLGIGLSALTKPSFSLFLIGPFLLIIGRRATQLFKTRRYPALKQMGANMALAGLVTLPLSLPWYVFHAKEYLAEQQFYYGVVYAFKWSAGYLSKLLEFNLAWILSRLLLWPVALLFGIALVYLLARVREHRWTLLAWMGVPYLFFLAAGLPDGFLMIRYLLPILPAVALVLALFLHRAAEAASQRAKIAPSRLTIALLLIILSIDIPLFLFISYRGNGELRDPFGRAEGNAGWLIGLNYFGRTSPHRIGFEIGEVAETLKQEMASTEKRPIVFFLNRHGMMSDALLAELEAEALRHDDFSFATSSCLVIRLTDEATRWLDRDSCLSQFLAADYAVLEEVNLQEFWVWDTEMYSGQVAPVAAELEELSRNHTLLMRLQNNLRAPDGYITLDPSFRWLGRDIVILKRPPALAGLIGDAEGS